MKIIDRLKPGEVIKLGPKNGSGFVFCGEVTPHTIFEIEKELEEVKASKKRFLTTLRNRERRFQSEKYRKTFGRAKADKRLKQTKWSIDKVEKYLATYIPLSQRELIEEYPSTYEVAQILIMEGSERGEYWEVVEVLRKGEQR